MAGNSKTSLFLLEGLLCLKNVFYISQITQTPHGPFVLDQVHRRDDRNSQASVDNRVHPAFIAFIKFHTADGLQNISTMRGLPHLKERFSVIEISRC